MEYSILAPWLHILGLISFDDIIGQIILHPRLNLPGYSHKPRTFEESILKVMTIYPCVLLSSENFILDLVTYWQVLQISIIH